MGLKVTPEELARWEAMGLVDPPAPALQTPAAPSARPAAKRAAGRTGLVAAAFVPPATWTIPLLLQTATNGQQLDRGMIARAAAHRPAVARHLAAHLAALVPLAAAAQAGHPVRCRIVRLGGRAWDDDAIPPAAKWVRDTVALFLGVGDGPRGPVAWRYGQEPGGPAGVRVELTLAPA